MSDDPTSTRLINTVTVPAILVPDGDATSATQVGIIQAVRIPVHIVAKSPKQARAPDS